MIVCLKRTFELIVTPTQQDDSAKGLVLEAAQRLFAREGFEKVSMRTLTQEAGVNLASVNYHFRSKQGLIDAVIAGYVNPVNEARLASLDAAESTCKGEPLPLDQILDCFMRPVLEAVHKSQISEQLFFQLMGRCLNNQSLKTMPDEVMGLFREVVVRFPQAIRKTLPDLSEKESLWRLHFTVGVLIHVLIHTEGLQQLAGDRLGSPSVENILTMVKGYCQAGLEAPETKFKPHEA